MEGTLPPLQVLDRNGQFDVGEPVEELLQGGCGDQPGGAFRRAGVRARTPRKVRPVAGPAVAGETGAGVRGGQADHKWGALAYEVSLEVSGPLDTTVAPGPGNITTYRTTRSFFAPCRDEAALEALGGIR